MPKNSSKTIAPLALNTFDEAVAAVRAGEPHLSACDAMSKARDIWPHLYAKYNADGLAAVRKANEPVLAKGKMAFETEVDLIRERDGCSRTKAMKRARRSKPDLYEQMQNG